jgi:hypothetical protein
MDIDEAHRVDAEKIAAAGWAGAVHLAPGGVLWCVTLVTPDHEFANFSPLASGQLRQLMQFEVNGGGDVNGQIREAVPSGP